MADKNAGSNCSLNCSYDFVTKKINRSDFLFFVTDGGVDRGFIINIFCYLPLTAVHSKRSNRYTNIIYQISKLFLNNTHLHLYFDKVFLFFFYKSRFLVCKSLKKERQIFNFASTPIESLELLNFLFIT